jgi:hypothetical protein
VRGRDGKRGSSLHVVAAPGSEDKDAAAHLPGAGWDEDGRAPSRARPRATKRTCRLARDLLGWVSKMGWARHRAEDLAQVLPHSR